MGDEMSKVQTLNNKILVSNGAVLVYPEGGGGGNAQASKSYTVAASGTQTISPDTGYDSMQEVALSVPTGSAGTPSATKGTVSNHAISVTPSVTNTTGWISGDTKNGTAVSVSASELVSGTYNVTSSGTKDVTNYASASVPSGTATAPASISGTSASVSTGTNTLTLSKTVSVTPNVSTAGYISSGTAGNSSVSLTASITTKAAATINTSTSDQTIASGTYLTGAQTIKAVTTTNLIAGNIKNGVTVEVGDANDSDRIISVTGTYEGSGGGSNLQVGTATTTPSSASSSISFTGLSGEPTSFVVTSMSDLATGSSPWKTASVVYDGTNVIGQVITNTSNAQVTYDSSGFSKSYSNGTLTITGTSTNFQANQYKLVYTYGGSSGNIGTDDVQVGSGATSITFTGLSDEPSYFSCIFKSNFSTSSGYQRVITVVYDGTSTYGLAMDSGAKADTNWSYTYNNGSLTISSSGTNAGGYFHQPGYYQLTYATGEVIELTAEPLSVTQNGTYTAPKGKAYTPVTVNVSGGGGANIATVTMTNSSNQNTSIDFTLPSGRTPKAFFARLTSQIARSSSYRYYYVYDMRWDGSSTGGVAGNQFYMYSGTLNDVTSGYSYAQSGTTFTLSSTGSRSAAPGSFYNGTYELVYVY